MIALRAQGLTRRFGALAAVSDVTLALERGARHALIGPNGAGKTTLLNLLAGSLAPAAGEVFLGEERITHLAPHARVQRGLARTFQLNSLFAGLTVLESVLLAALQRRGEGGAVLRPVRAHREALDEAHEVVARMGLEADAARRASELPYGRQKRVEIALALATRPRVLLLDEPAAGIPSTESVEVLGAIAALPEDVTVLFIEHDMGLVFRFARRITVLVGGRVLAEGDPESIAADERVRSVYLGREVHG